MMFNCKHSRHCFTGISAVNLTCVHIINEQVSQAVRHLACILDVLGSNLGRTLDYRDRGIHGFPRFVQANSGIMP
jgi:hypothetical protein